MEDAVLQEIGVPCGWWDPEGSLRSDTVPRDFPLLHRFQSGWSSCTNTATAHTDIRAHTSAADFDACACAPDATVHASSDNTAAYNNFTAASALTAATQHTCSTASRMAQQATVQSRCAPRPQPPACSRWI